MVYAIVRAGGRQEKVEVGTIVTMNRIAASSGSVELPAVLLVDGDKVTSDSKSLAKVKVVAEVLEQTAAQRFRFRSTRTRLDTRSVRATART